MKKIAIIIITVSVLLSFQGCNTCGMFGRDPSPLLGTIFKYKQGLEYPDNIYINRNNVSERSGYILNPQRIISLDSGYYYRGGSDFYTEWEDIILMNFTKADLDNGRVPEDWTSHWEDFVLAENPFEKCCVIEIKECGNPRPYDCTNCGVETNYVDTLVLKQMVTSGAIWNPDYVVGCREAEDVNKNPTCSGG